MASKSKMAQFIEDLDRDNTQRKDELERLYAQQILNTGSQRIDTFPPKTTKRATDYEDTVQSRAAQLRRFLQESHDVLQLFYQNAENAEDVTDSVDLDSSVFRELNTATDLAIRLVERLRQLYAEVGTLKFGEVE